MTFRISSSKMLQLVHQFILLSILFSRVLGETQGEKDTYFFPEIYDEEKELYHPALHDTDVPSKVKLKYRTKRYADSCKHKAYAEQIVTFHHTLSILDGEKIKEISTTRTSEPASHALGIHERMPVGKLTSKILL